MDCSTPGLSVHHQLPELTQTHVHWVGDAMQPSHPLSSPSPLNSIYPSIRVFSNESVLHIRWPRLPWRSNPGPRRTPSLWGMPWVVPQQEGKSLMGLTAGGTSDFPSPGDCMAAVPSIETMHVQRCHLLSVQESQFWQNRIPKMLQIKMGFSSIYRITEFLNWRDLQEEINQKRRQLTVCPLLWELCSTHPQVRWGFVIPLHQWEAEGSGETGNSSKIK